MIASRPWLCSTSTGSDRIESKPIRGLCLWGLVPTAIVDTAEFQWIARGSGWRPAGQTIVTMCNGMFSYIHHGPRIDPCTPAGLRRLKNNSCSNTRHDESHHNRKKVFRVSARVTSVVVMTVLPHSTHVEGATSSSASLWASD